MLIEKVGTPAMLEQTAEECIELAHVCLKLARSLRGENKCYKPLEVLFPELAEEMADVRICIDELIEGDVLSNESVESYIMRKHERMAERLKREDYIL